MKTRIGSDMIDQISKCRLCESKKLEIIVDLKQQSLSGYFPPSADTDVEVFPLVLVKFSVSYLFAELSFWILDYEQVRKTRRSQFG